MNGIPVGQAATGTSYRAQLDPDGSNSQPSARGAGGLLGCAALVSNDRCGRALTRAVTP